MIDSIYILSNNLVLMEKHWSTPIPDRSIIDKIKPSSGTVTKCGQHENTKYLIKNSTPNSEINFIALISKEFPLSFILTALQQVRLVFESYVKNLTAIKIQENDVILYQVISEMFDAGYPIVTDADELKEIILPPTILNNLMDSVTSLGRAKDVIPGKNQLTNGHGDSASSKSNSSSITSQASSYLNNKFSKSNASDLDQKNLSKSTLLSRTDNELNLDINENITCIINRNGQIIKAEIIGEILANSKFSISQNQNLQASVFISFINPMILTEQAGCSLAVHSKINKIRWRDDRTFIYKPSQGISNIRLAKYHLIGSDKGIPIQQVARAMPVNVSSNINFYEDRGILLLTVSNRTLAGSGNIASKVQPVNNVVISTILPNFVTSCSVIEDNISNSTSNTIANTLTGSSQQNLSTFDSNTKFLEWRIGKILHGKPVTCKFKLSTSLKVPVNKINRFSASPHSDGAASANANANANDLMFNKNIAIKVNFKVDQYTMSGIKLNRVDMNLNNTSAKLFKTIKYSCESESVDFRC